MAAKTRLGLSATTRGLYGSFAGKLEETALNGGVSSLISLSVSSLISLSVGANGSLSLSMGSSSDIDLTVGKG